ncbi:MAG: metalloregulator ArsR/SmtB family transcription factor [Chloroflexi bacterium]|nr:metalloregulator ArsR/SmtB family transcription factor [Chloroflexota bacterium]
MDAQVLDQTFAALADPTRRAILARLASEKRGVGVMELAAPFAMSLPAVSKHLKVLERANLISRGREAQWRPCTLEPRLLKEAANWIERYRELWEERFDQLDSVLEQLQNPQDN